MERRKGRKVVGRKQGRTDIVHCYFFGHVSHQDRAKEITRKRLKSMKIMPKIA